MDGNSLKARPLRRSEEVADLIDAVKALIIPFVQSADEAATTKATGQSSSGVPGQPSNGLVEALQPQDLVRKLALSLPAEDGLGKKGLLELVQRLLRYSVNTWDQGFLDKLYASPNAVGVTSEMLLAVLNTNLHVYAVSPALTSIEKTTARSLASLFGFRGPHAGGITCQGGSGSNLTSLVIARNTLYPATKRLGNGSHSFAVFTSAHGHYSVEKAAQALGLGSDAVVGVGVDSRGRMVAEELERAVVSAREAGRTPLYVNATAGTTVLGSFDPLTAVADVCRRQGVWMHVDASWGGGAVFSPTQRHKLAGAELADSLTFNPHKMLGVPVTCSFLLGPDLRVFHRANTLPAGYLFHGGGGEGEGEGEGEASGDVDVEGEVNGRASNGHLSSLRDEEVWDLADLTLQCGRRGDALKLALAWVYEGLSGLGAYVDAGFAAASYLADLLGDAAASPHARNFRLVSERPPPCLQVCFYYVPDPDAAVAGGDGGVGAGLQRRQQSKAEDRRRNSRVTAGMVRRLVGRGFMVDYAPGGEEGDFFRVVVNGATRKETVDGLVKALVQVGREETAREGGVK